MSRSGSRGLRSIRRPRLLSPTEPRSEIPLHEDVRAGAWSFHGRLDQRRLRRLERSVLVERFARLDVRRQDLHQPTDS